MVSNGFLVNNLLPFYNAITGTGIASGYEYKSAVDGIPSNYIRSTTPQMDVDIDLGGGYASLNFDSFGLFYLDPNFDYVTVYLSNVSYGGAGESVSRNNSYSSNRTFWQKEKDTNQLIENPLESLYYCWGVTKSYRYIRFRFNNIAGSVRIGSIFLGTKIEMEKEPKTVVPVYKTFRTRINVDGNVISSQDSEQEGFKLTYQFLEFSNRENHKWVIRDGIKVYVPDFTENDCYLGYVSQDKIDSPKLYDKYNGMNVTFMEQGITEALV